MDSTLHVSGGGLTMSMTPVIVEPIQYVIHPDCPNEVPVASPAMEGDVGFDLRVWIPKGSLVIWPFSFANIPTGVFVKLPTETWGDIRPRSSTFAKRRLFVMGGTIDSGYTGQLSIFIFNPSWRPHKVYNGDRLAQLVVGMRVAPSLVKVLKLPETARSQAGFGSSGTN